MCDLSQTEYIAPDGVSRMEDTMLFRAIVASLVAASAAATQAAPSHAETLCHDRAVILERLKVAYAEMPRAVGLTADGAVLEILASATGSWTILVTYPSLTTCVLAAGEAWETLPVAAADRPA